MTGPAVDLGVRQTPLEPAPRLAARLGLGPQDLWIKRDDLTSLGAGGNKVRKLQHTMGEAVAQGAAAVVTSGAPQSNHARLTAAAAARLGLRAVLVLSGSPPDVARGNLLLGELFGARVVWAGEVDEAALTVRATQEADRLRAAGVPTAVIPFGGTSVTGAQGYVQAARELLDQAPDLTAVVVAVGSGGTMAGLVHGLGAERVLGIDTGAVADPERRVLDLVLGLAGHAPASGLRLRRDLVGAGYAHLTDEVREAMTLVARSEGIALDPVYTGRAAAGLVAAVRDGTVRPGQRTVLLHTGGLPGLFGHPDAGSAWAPGPVDVGAALGPGA